MSKNEVKFLLVITIILSSICLVSYFIFSKIEKEANILNADVIIDGNRFLNYEQGEWTDLQSIKDIAMNEFKVYSGNNYINNYFVTITNEKHYFFDSNYESYNIESPFLAISKESNLSIIGYNEVSFSNEDNNIIDKYLKENNINYNGEYSIKKKYITDLNDDENEDSIYILCNELYDTDVFYIIFANVGKELITINKQIDMDIVEKYELIWILNSVNKGYSDIILRKSLMENYDYYLFSYNDKKEYQEIIPY